MNILNSRQVTEKQRDLLKELQILWGIEHQIPFVAFDSELLYKWLNLMNETVRDAGEIESVEGLIMGHSSAQSNGVKIHQKFKSRIGKLLDGQVPGYTAHWALSTDGWTSQAQFEKKN